MASGDFTCKLHIILPLSSCDLHTYIPVLTLLDYGSNLVVWGAAETAVTLIACSIPILRTLISDIRKSTANQSSYAKQSSGRDPTHFGTSRNVDVNTYAQRDPGRDSAFAGQTAVTSMGRYAKREADGTMNDSDSDKSTLPIHHTGRTEILKTEEVHVEYDRKSDWRENEIEMYRFDVEQPHQPQAR